MNYLIDAWLENGIPQLSIRDADTGAIRLRWSRTDPSRTASTPEESEVEASRALQRLFKGLVLVSCTDKHNLTELAKTPGGDQSCLICDACVARSENTSQGVQPDKLLRLVDQRPKRKPDARR